MRQRGVFYLQRKSDQSWDTLQEAGSALILRSGLAGQLATDGASEVRIVAGHSDPEIGDWVYEQVFYIDPSSIDLGFGGDDEADDGDFEKLDDEDPLLAVVDTFEPIEEERPAFAPEPEYEPEPEPEPFHSMVEEDEDTSNDFQERMAALNERTLETLSDQFEPDESEPVVAISARPVPEYEDPLPPPLPSAVTAPPRQRGSWIGFLFLFLLATLIVAAAGLGTLVYQQHPLVMQWSDKFGATQWIHKASDLISGQMADSDDHDKDMERGKDGDKDGDSDHGAAKMEKPMAMEKVEPLTTGQIVTYAGVPPQLRLRWSTGDCKANYIEFSQNGVVVVTNGTGGKVRMIQETLEDDYQFYLRLAADHLQHFQKLGPNDLQPAGATTKDGLQTPSGSISILSRCK